MFISNIILLDLQKSHFADDFKTKYEAMKRNGIAYPIKNPNLQKGDETNSFTTYDDTIDMF